MNNKKNIYKGKGNKDFYNDSLNALMTLYQVDVLGDSLTVKHRAALTLFSGWLKIKDYLFDLNISKNILHAVDTLIFGGICSNAYLSRQKYRIAALELSYYNAESLLSYLWKQVESGKYVRKGKVKDTNVLRHIVLKVLIARLPYESVDDALIATSYYTDYRLCKAIWLLAQRLGFSGGLVVDGSCGIGNFIETKPADMPIRFVGCEKDPITARIATLLHPSAMIVNSAFQYLTVQQSVDLIIGTVPILDDLLYDKQQTFENWHWHEHYLAKSIQLLKPKQLLILVMPSVCMDDKSTNFRTWVLQEGSCDFIGAVRLPNSILGCMPNDIVILQKRSSSAVSHHRTSWLSLDRYTHEETPLKEQAIYINEYYVQHPKMMIGNMLIKKQAKGTFVVDSNNISWQLSKSNSFYRALWDAIQLLPTNIINNTASIAPNLHAGELISQTFFLRNSLPYYCDAVGEVVRIESVLTMNQQSIFDNKYLHEFVVCFVLLKESVKHFWYLEKQGESEECLIVEKNNINKYYSVLARWCGGTIGKSKNKLIKQLATLDIEYSIVAYLEQIEEEISVKPLARKKYNVTFKPLPILRLPTAIDIPTVAKNISEASDISMRYKNRLDISFMADLLNWSNQQVEEGLVISDVAYQHPITKLWEQKATYLSGFVRQKLIDAIAAAENDCRFQRNVNALEKIQPKDIPFHYITFGLASRWMPPPIVRIFIKEKLGVTCDVIFQKSLDKWFIVNTQNTSNFRNSKKYGGGGCSAIELMRCAMNMTKKIVYKQAVDGSGKREKDIEATEAAAVAQHQLNETFRQYILSHKEYHQVLERLYNNRFNSCISLEQYADNKSGYIGASDSALNCRSHQRKGVQLGKANSHLFWHVVGSGKTLIMTHLLVELLRLGKIEQGFLVVKNGTETDFMETIAHQYPHIRVLCPMNYYNDARLDKRIFMSSIYFCKYDLVIIPHSKIGFIADHPIMERKMLLEEIGYLERDANTSTFINSTIGIDSIKKQISKKQSELLSVENKITRFEQTISVAGANQFLKEDKLQLLIDAEQVPFDNVFNWQELLSHKKIALAIDEVHYYKRQQTQTRMTNIKGIDVSQSQRASSMLLKVRAVQEQHHGGGTFGFTGTLVSNTLAEIYNAIRMFRPEVLKKYHIYTFDSFVSVFAEVISVLEMTVGGTYKWQNVLAKFVNIPELQKLTGMAVDVVTNEDIKEFINSILPTVADNGMTHVVCDRSEELEAYMNDLKKQYKRFEQLRGIEKRKNRHIPLVLFGKARGGAICMNMVAATDSEESSNKIIHCINTAFATYKRYDKYQATQLIFCDWYNGVNIVKNGIEEPYNAHQAIKQGLIEKGIPAKEIAIYTDKKYNSKAAKKKLFKLVNAGKKRFLIGGKSMSTGLNVQEMLIAIHIVDVPQLPSEFEQKVGRLVRQNNIFAKLNIPVHVFTYATKGSMDVIAFERLARKQKMIMQMLKSGNILSLQNRIMEDVGDMVIGFEEIKAMLLGEDGRTRYELEKKIASEQTKYDAYLNGLEDAKRTLRTAEKRKIELQELIQKSIHNERLLSEIFDNGKIAAIAINNTVYTKKLNKHLQSAIDIAKESLVEANQKELVEIQLYGSSMNKALCCEISCTIKETFFTDKDSDKYIEIEGKSYCYVLAIEIKNYIHANGTTFYRMAETARGFLALLRAFIEKEYLVKQRYEEAMQSLEKDVDSCKDMLHTPYDNSVLNNYKEQLNCLIKQLESKKVIF